ncbi:MAG: NUMOD4 domain-containing protein [Pseudonocardiaceae bacterium]
MEAGRQVSETSRERWLPVADYRDSYQVSNEGRVRSVSREVHCENGVIKRLQGCVMASHADKRGYCRVALRFDGSQTT